MTCPVPFLVSPSSPPRMFDSAVMKLVGLMEMMCGSIAASFGGGAVQTKLRVQ